MTGRAFGAVVAGVLVLVLAGEASAGLQHPQAFLDRGEAAFADGRIEDAVAEFDRLAAFDPETAPWLWQRGIALYYLGRFDACAEQFAAYQGVNPGDLESAVWHVACAARSASIEAARGQMFPPGPDRRVMRAEIYELFAGRLPVSAVIERAGFVAEVAVFYACFYSGLYAEVTGDVAGARRFLARATEPRYAGLGGFMGVVAQVHRARLANQAPENSNE